MSIETHCEDFGHVWKCWKTQLFCDPNAIFKIYDTENILSELKIYHVASVRHEDPCPEPCRVGMWNMSSCSEMPHKDIWDVAVTFVSNGLKCLLMFHVWTATVQLCCEDQDKKSVQNILWILCFKYNGILLYWLLLKDASLIVQSTMYWILHYSRVRDKVPYVLTKQKQLCVCVCVSTHELLLCQSAYYVV